MGASPIAIAAIDGEPEPICPGRHSKLGHRWDYSEGRHWRWWSCRDCGDLVRRRKHAYAGQLPLPTHARQWHAIVPCKERVRSHAAALVYLGR